MRGLPVIGVVCAVAAVGSCVAETEKSACEADGGAIVSGGFRVGKEALPGSAPPTAFPFKTSAIIESTVLIERVTIGGVPANLKAGAVKEWEADLYPIDLERNRVGNEARLTIVATDVCNVSHPLADEAAVPLGPAPGVAVSDLSVEVELSPTGECAVPVNGRVQPLVRLRASAASSGAKVKLQANQGKFSGGESSQTLTLAPEGDGAAQLTFFSPEKVGYAVISASAEGVSATPVVLPVVGPPEITAPTSPLEKGTEYFATVRSTGNLSWCVIEEEVAAAASVTVVDPPLGPITGVLDVRSDPVACAETELLRVKVVFATESPDGAAVTLRCADTFDQEQSVRLDAAADPADAG